MNKNAFDVLRIFSAVQVMLLHFNAFFYQSAPIPGKHSACREIVRMFPGVVILFTLSGFLIAASYENSSSVKEFFRKRILRIYPPLWLCTIVNLLVLFCLGQDIFNKGMLIWLCTQIIGIANTPAALKGFATGSINGALWTVFTEIQLYVVLAFTYRRVKKMSLWGWGAVGFLLLMCNLGACYLQDFGHVIPKIVERLFLPYALWFYIGVFLYIYREKFILTPPHKWVLVLLLLFILYKCGPIQAVGYYTDIVTSICLPFITIGMAYALGDIRIKPDLSYHLFLYHWIVLNVLVHYGCFAVWSLAQSLAVFFTASIGVSLLSYYLCAYLTKPWTRRFIRSSAR